MKFGKFELKDWQEQTLGGYVRYSTEYASKIDACVCVYFGISNNFKMMWEVQFNHNLYYLNKLFKQTYPTAIECDGEKIKKLVDDFLIRMDKILIFS